MPDQPDFQAVFDQLKPLMQALEPECVVLHDQPGKYYLALPPVPEIKKELWLGGVEIKKNYVSYHLVPVYAQPELLTTISDGLRKRMQGKSCFNFKKIDAAQLAELADLTGRGFASFKESFRTIYKV
jgi:hypothetical protein